MDATVRHVNSLQDQVIQRWVGFEMAIGGGDTVMDEHTPTTGVWAEKPAVWEHATVPFAQFVSMDLFLATGAVYRLYSQIDDGSDSFGLKLQDLSQPEGTSNIPLRSVYRIRELSCLPVGLASVQVLRQNGDGAVIEFLLRIGEATVRFLAAEVYERDTGRFEVCEPDESVLVHLNGLRPPSPIERTPKGAAPIEPEAS